jgi:Arc/MetJ-type ribon-helix-helix transcriptional regulator
LAVAANRGRLDMAYSMIYDNIKYKTKRRFFMPTISTHSPKAKITVTLSPDLISELDSFVNSSGGSSRSRLVEEALWRWLHDEAKKELERQTEEYYHALSKAENKEDREWAKISARSAKRLWEK